METALLERMLDFKERWDNKAGVHAMLALINRADPGYQAACVVNILKSIEINKDGHEAVEALESVALSIMLAGWRLREFAYEEALREE